MCNISKIFRIDKDIEIEGRRRLCTQKTPLKFLLSMAKGVEECHVHKKLNCDLCYLWIKVLKEEDKTLYIINSACCNLCYLWLKFKKKAMYTRDSAVISYKAKGSEGRWDFGHN